MTTQETYDAAMRELDGLWDVYLNRHCGDSDYDLIKSAQDFSTHWHEAVKHIISLKTDLELREQAEANALAAMRVA